MKSCRVHCRVVIVNLAAIASLLLVGCPTAKTPAPAKSSGAATSQPLVLLVVDDPQLGQAISREWRGRTEEELTIRDVPLEQVAKANRLPGDAIIFPSGMIGQLAEGGLIAPLEPGVLEDADFNYRDIFDQIRMGEMRWGNRTFAVPLGSPQLLLAYRADLFEKLGQKPPEDWTEYQQTAVRLADQAALGDVAPPADQPWRATIEPLAAGWRGQLLLARAAAYAMHRDQVSPLFRFETMMPLIDQPPYVRALEELVAAAKVGGFAEQRLTPTEVFAEMRAGHCAMAITWPTADISDSATTEKETRLRFALLPGASQAYRFATKTWESRSEDDASHVPLRCVWGRMAALAASSADPRRAQGFVAWLAGREVSQQIGPRSGATTLFRNSHVATSARWTGSLAPDVSRQYADVLAQTLSLPRSFPGLTVPGRLDYLTALDEAVRQAIDGKPAAEALSEAAKQWSAITEKLDVESQRRANARCLGQSEL
ncbi:MAG TPA: extracellular solute-binding protein [Pirellulaceae bacterium]|nr:extracellular solute-binding protein [Pirellulaceae bacterium]